MLEPGAGTDAPWKDKVFDEVSKVHPVVPFCGTVVPFTRTTMVPGSAGRLKVHAFNTGTVKAPRGAAATG